jgi:hypothetical protein
MKTISYWNRSSWFSVLAVTTIGCSAELPETDQGGSLAQGVTAPPAEVPRSLYQAGITARASALIDPNPSTYLYAPTVMFDETSGHYKMWACGGATNPAGTGDTVIYKEATTLEGLGSAGWQQAFFPRFDGKFDHTHACDPSVIRVGTDFYLYYSGMDERESSPRKDTTSIGVAKSSDGGRTFTRLNGGNPIAGLELPLGSFDPGAYGTGQPAVVQAPNGYFYMIYTHQEDRPAQSKNRSMLRVIRSLDPAFSTWEPVRDINSGLVGSYSVDLAFNPSRNQFVVVSNVAQPNNGVDDGVRVKLLHFDLSFAYLGETLVSSNPGFELGENVAVLTNSRRELARLADGGASSLTFVAATEKTLPPTDPRFLVPSHVVGPMMMASFRQATGSGDSAILSGFTPRGWDLGVYNPTGTDGNFYIYRGEGSGFFSDQTSWNWGAFPTGKVFSGDFNGDGKWDVGLYNPNATDGNFFIQYGNGAGGFSSQTAWHWGVFPQGQVFTGDFNKDGKWDVGVYNPSGNDGNFYIQYGNGAGGFSGQTVWHWGVFPTGKVFTGDFNNDGRWDVGLYNPNATDGSFFIQYGDGTGGFGGQTAWPWGVFPSAQVITGDFNRDGKWDVGLANPLGDGRVFVQLGNGAGAFGGQTVFSWVGSGQYFTGNFGTRMTY